MPPSPQAQQGLTVWNFGTLTVTLTFSVILMERGMEPYAAILHAIGAVAAIMFLILLPARLVEVYKQVKLVSQLAGHMDLSTVIATAVHNATAGNNGNGSPPPPAGASIGDGSQTTP